MIPDLKHIELVFIFIILFSIVKYLTVILHELGHGITALIWVRSPITIFIGTHGNRKYSLSFMIKRIKFYVCLGPFGLLKGLTVFDMGNDLPFFDTKKISDQNKFWIVLAGPLTTLSLLIIAVGVFYIFDSDPVKFISALLFCSFMMDFLYSVIPRKKKIRTGMGVSIYNDGYQLMLLIKRMMRVRSYQKRFVNNKADAGYRNPNSRSDGKIVNPLDNES